VEGIPAAFEIGGFLSAKQTVHCKRCRNLKMETAVEVMGGDGGEPVVFK